MAISKEASNNFETLKRAVLEENLALMECTDQATGLKVNVICAVNTTKGEDDQLTYEFVPLAKQFMGDPYTEVLPPMPGEETEVEAAL